MSKNEMITMIETMNNYDDLAAKAKAKADAIREAIKEEMIRQDTEELVAGAYIVRFTGIVRTLFAVFGSATMMPLSGVYVTDRLTLIVAL